MQQNKELHRVMSILSPFWSYPKCSRFHEFFENLPLLTQKSKSSPDLVYPSKETKKRVKRGFQINIENILSGYDKRTTIMIKNISTLLSKETIEYELKKFCKFNYLYIPNNNKSNKGNLGFIFINLQNYKDIVYLNNYIYNSNFFNNLNGNKNLSINYSKIQGRKELIKAFGSEYIYNFI
jgi:hypothetical protein